MWDWQEAIAKKFTREQIIHDMLSESSLLFDIAKEDVMKILQKTNFNWIVQNMNFDDIYPHSLKVTTAQLKWLLNRNKGFLKCEDICEEKNRELVRRIVQRIANNTKNLFDDRYKTCIKQDIRFHLYGSELIDENDALSIMILEEDIAEAKEVLERLNKEYLQDIIPLIAIDENNQTYINFEEK